MTSLQPKPSLLLALALLVNISCEGTVDPPGFPDVGEAVDSGPAADVASPFDGGSDGATFDVVDFDGGPVVFDAAAADAGEDSAAPDGGMADGGMADGGMADSAPPFDAGPMNPCGPPRGIMHQFRGEDGVESWTAPLNFTTPEQPHSRVNITSPMDLVPFGSASMRVEIRPGDPQWSGDRNASSPKRRAEFSWADWRYPGGAEGWVGAAFYLPSDPMANNRGTAIFQLHNWPDDGTLWNIYVFGGRIRTHNHPMGDIFDEDITPYLDRWTRVVVHFKSSTGNDGFIQMWLDDELVLDVRGPTKPSGSRGPYFKHGAYFWGYETHDSRRHAIAYFDNLRIADDTGDFNSVNPACW